MIESLLSSSLILPLAFQVSVPYKYWTMRWFTKYKHSSRYPKLRDHLWAQCSIRLISNDSFVSYELTHCGPVMPCGEIRSALAQVMDFCLTVSSCYPRQCRFHILRFIPLHKLLIRIMSLKIILFISMSNRLQVSDIDMKSIIFKLSE